MKTTEELEREAYLQGNTEVAKLLAKLVEQENRINDLEDQLEWEQRNG